MARARAEDRQRRRGGRLVIFVQLPQLDNDTGSDHENVPLAAAYLQYAAERAGEGRYYRFERLSAADEACDTPSLAQRLAVRRPAVLALSLYVWNVERSLRLARAVKALWPQVWIVAGGPEVARRHPLIFRSRVLDAIGVGEGEGVFPALLAACRQGRHPDLESVAVRTRQGYRWGRAPVPEVSLDEALPPADYAACRPDARGIAYLETSRGCPFRCTYCRYPHLRRRMTFLAPDEVARRVAALRGLGAREIRLVDPTFNAHPRFADVLERLGRANRDRRVRFFVELGAERVTDEQADRLAAAHVTEVEVGMQSRSADVLAAIRRPTDLGALEQGVRRLVRRGMRVTLDVMYGLPRQRRRDVDACVRWARRLRGVDVQCLQTLLLPGTELRERRAEWGVRACGLPPYGVLATSTLTAGDMRRIEARLAADPRLRSDIRTERFVGRRLPGMFAEEVTVDITRWARGMGVPGTAARRAVLLPGQDLFGRRARLAAFIGSAIRRDPDMLWQFVVIPSYEEPLELFEALIAAVRARPLHLLDRYGAALGAGRVASRRVLVRLPGGRRFERGWVEAVEACLGAAFF